MAIGKECLYPGHCTFAYCQEEIDVWTLERKGFISRELLFDPYGPNSNIRLTVPKILQEHHGIFMFLCGVSIDLISKLMTSECCGVHLIYNNNCIALPRLEPDFVNDAHWQHCFFFYSSVRRKKYASHCKWIFTSKDVSFIYTYVHL